MLRTVGFFLNIVNALSLNRNYELTKKLFQIQVTRQKGSRKFGIWLCSTARCCRTEQVKCLEL